MQTAVRENSETIAQMQEQLAQSHQEIARLSQRLLLMEQALTDKATEIRALKSAGKMILIALVWPFLLGLLFAFLDSTWFVQVQSSFN